MINLSAETLQKLALGQIVWFATTRPDGRPHLAPVWFVWVDGKVYIGTEPESVKARNIADHPNVVVALEDGSHPVICEGIARHSSLPLPETVLAAFKQKYEWDLTTERQYHYVIEITPVKWLVW